MNPTKEIAERQDLPTEELLALLQSNGISVERTQGGGHIVELPWRIIDTPR